MLASLWYALAAFGTLNLLFWAYFQPSTRVYVSAGFSGATFLVLALTAPNVETLSTELGETIATPIPVTVQLLVGMLGALSLAVVWLFHAGLYPPEANTEDDFE